MAVDQNEFKDALNMDDYYSDLTASYQSSDTSENKPRLQKLWLNAPPNFGTIQMILYPSGHDKSYITHLENVRAIRFQNDEVNEDVPAWHRILPKEYYPDLSQEESSLYDEVNSLFDYIDSENGKIEDDKNKLVGFLDFKPYYTWNFFFAKILRAYSLNNAENKEIKPEASFLCYPGAKIKKGKIKEGLDALVKKGLGPVANWAHYFFNANEKNRNGIVSITHSLPGAGGYDTNFEFIFDGQSPAPGLPAIKLVPDDFVITEDDKRLFSNSLIAFLGKMYDFENKRIFNKKVFVAMKNHMIGLIQSHAGGGTPVTSTPAPSVAPSQPAYTAPPPPIPANGLVDPLAGVSGIPKIEVPPVQASIPVPPVLNIPGLKIPGVNA